METTTTRTVTIEGKEKLIKGSPLVEITRAFKAPISRVWNAWAEPELAKQWWGPENYSCPEAKIDFREGGKYLLAMKDPSGKVMWDTGRYDEIVFLQKIVCTDSFADKNGNMISAKEAGMSGDWGDVSTITVEFESTYEDETIMHLRHEGIPKEMHDDCVSGWSTSFDKLQKLVERI